MLRILEAHVASTENLCAEEIHLFLRFHQATAHRTEILEQFAGAPQHQLDTSSVFRNGRLDWWVPTTRVRLSTASSRITSRISKRDLMFANLGRSDRDRNVTEDRRGHSDSIIRTVVPSRLLEPPAPPPPPRPSCMNHPGLPRQSTSRSSRSAPVPSRWDIQVATTAGESTRSRPPPKPGTDCASVDTSPTGRRKPAPASLRVTFMMTSTKNTLSIASSCNPTPCAQLRAAFTNASNQFGPCAPLVG